MTPAWTIWRTRTGWHAQSADGLWSVLADPKLSLDDACANVVITLREWGLIGEHDKLSFIFKGVP
jgi:hypothetical protein